MAKRKNKPTNSPSHVVTKSNDLVQAGYKLSLNEQRLVLLAISRVNTARGIHKEFYFQVSAVDFSAQYGLELKHSYEAIKDAANRLYERDVRVFDGKGTKERFRWVFHAHYRESQGCVDLGFSPNVVKHLIKMKGQFTSYELSQVSRLNSASSVRLYEMCKQFQSTGIKRVSLVDLKASLGIEGKYKAFQDFARRVLLPSLSAINEQTDLAVSFEPYRSGRKIAGITFSIRLNDQKDMFKQ
jgi:plasmid replication initiation protein